MGVFWVDFSPFYSYFYPHASPGVVIGNRDINDYRDMNI